MRAITPVLTALLVFDVVLTAWGFLFPQWWFAAFHGTGYDDPEGFLRRCAANWLMFAVLQALALVRWRRAPGWLLLVAGARFGDMLTDWSYLVFATHTTWFAWVGLLGAGPLNLFAGLFLVRAWERVRVASGGS